MSSITIRSDGSHGSGAPYSNWSTERGTGYCSARSATHARRLGHLFTSRQTIAGVTTTRCAWCWQPTKGNP